jgi:prepilin-type N-terminal cleavage/methylation domain-containing protein
MTRRATACREGGFSFIEILVVMGIIAVLVGVGVGAWMLAARKAPQVKTEAMLSKTRSNLDMWRAKFRAYPPSNMDRLPLVTNIQGLKVGQPNPQNLNNYGIESLLQALKMPGFGHNPDYSDDDFCNTDEDFLDKALAADGVRDLLELKDAWGNPLIYLVEADYAPSEKDPPVYVNGAGEAIYPKAWKAAAGGFEQPSGYQLFSVGPDGQPNTDDDMKSWQSK